MLKEKMKLVAASEGVNIYCPKDGRSPLNSPYPAHRSYTDIDIYLRKNLW